MKNSLLALCLPLLLASCASMRITETHVASGASSPRAIYIRPFDVTEARVKGNQGTSAERVIRGSLAPAEFASDLKEEMEKIAPAAVVKDDEMPKYGWLVEGEFEWIHAGSPFLRLFGPPGAGRSYLIIHVHITDLDHMTSVGAEAKDENGETTYKTVTGRHGTVIYDFTLRGGSKLTGPLGRPWAPGGGDAVPFDFRNAAERVMMALTTDPYRYGARSTAPMP